MKANHMGVCGSFALAAMLAICVAFMPGQALAVGGEADVPAMDMKTVYIIGNINAGSTYPLQAYIIAADDLVLAETWWASDRDLGPVGLAIDDSNENLFISYEDGYTIDAFDAKTASSLGNMNLSGTDDLAGMVIHQTRELLYVVDRAENDVFVYDSNTFANLDHWMLPTGSGAWGIDLLGDQLFVGDATDTVRWYGIDSKTETGNYTTDGYECVGIVVIQTPEFASFTTGFTNHGYVIKHDMTTGWNSRLNVGSPSKGVTVNPATGILYVNADDKLRIVDAATLTILNEKLLWGWSPTDCLASTIDFGGTVEKTCTTHPGGNMRIGDAVTFEIKIENRHVRPIHVLPVKDVYDNTQLVYQGATPASDDNVDDGEIDWSDIISPMGGDLQPGDFYTVVVDFTATPEGCVEEVDGVNIGKMVGAEDDQGNSLVDAAGSFSYTIDCRCVSDAECDDGNYCNGTETCDLAVGSCVAGTDPCVDDGEFCNGEETCDEQNDVCVNSGDPCGDDEFCNGTETCNEDTDSCDSSGNPCEDDGTYCNGVESCNEDTDSCESSGNPCGDGIFCNGEEPCDEESHECSPSTGNPCEDDNLFCNGEEYCDEQHDECLHTGDPCDEDEFCNEEIDLCDMVYNVNDDGDGPNPWPEGEISGGCCGCD